MALWWKLLSCYRCLAFHWNSRLHKVFSLLVAVAPLLFFKSFCIRDLWCDWKPFMICLIMPYASLALMWKSFCWHFSANLNCQFLGSSFFSEQIFPGFFQGILGFQVSILHEFIQCFIPLQYQGHLDCWFDAEPNMKVLVQVKVGVKEVPGLEGWQFPMLLLIEVLIFNVQFACSEPALNLSFHGWVGWL